MPEDNFWDQFKDDDEIPFEKRERKEWVEPDPFTGGTQKVVTVGKSFMMVIPDRAIQLSPEEAEAFRTRLGVYRSTGPNTGIEDMDDKKALTFVTLGQVVATYVGRPAVDYQTDISRIAKYYGAQILEEPTEAWDKTAASVWPNIFGPPKQIITEDAEVVSIETAR